MSDTARLESLVSKHRLLETEIFEEAKRPAPDSEIMKDLKRRKLRLKDEIAQMEAR